MLTIHPTLVYAPFVDWALLSRQTEEAGTGTLGNPHSDSIEDATGLLGYSVAAVERVDAKTAQVTFAPMAHTNHGSTPAGPRLLQSFDLGSESTALGFKDLFSAFLQAHTLGWDMSYIPPALPSTASCSASMLIDARSSDDWFVIMATDANFGRYNIAAEHIARTMAKSPRVKNAVVWLGGGP